MEMKILSKILVQQFQMTLTLHFLVHTTAEDTKVIERGFLCKLDGRRNIVLVR